MKYILMSLLGIMLLSSCVSLQYHESAVYDPPLANTLINQLKKDTLLIVFPTYHDKERIVRSAIKKYPESKKKLYKDLEDVKKDRQYHYQTIKSSFNENFNFCEFLLIPDSLLHSFENGDEGPFFVNDADKLDGSISYSNKKPIKFLNRSYTEWDFRIGNKLPPNPFPNRISYRFNLLELLGIEDYSDIAGIISEALERRLDIFYNNPTRAVRL